MFHFVPPNATTLLLCDTRTLADANRDAKRKPALGDNSVLDNWAFGTEVWGKDGWKQTVARASLFEFSQEVKPKDRDAARTELKAFLRQHKFKNIIVLQSRSKSARKSYNDDYAEGKHAGTVCWEFFNPPGKLAEMAGSFWKTKHGLVLPLQNPQNVDYVYGALTVRWLTAIKRDLPLFLPPAKTTHTEAGAGMERGLQALLGSAVAGKPIAFDLETYSTQDLITVVGLSDGVTTCSVPWEPFTPHGQSYLEPGLHKAPEGILVRRILATARKLVGHNILRFDLPYLQRKGIPVGGFAFDTYLAHGILAPQFRHGLQQAVCSEFKVPPWKTAHRAEATKNGMDPDDAEAWAQNPRELRRYNASDVFYNWWLGERLASYGGVKL